MGDLQKPTVLAPEIETPGDTKWFIHDRFGLFIHFGLYALPARHEWVKNRERIPEEKYQKYFEHFNPDRFDPDEWAERAALARMKYFVVTTKHHEGFCLWDSKYTDYKAPNTPYGRDLLQPMVEAFRRRGLKVGFYHSLIDWHHPHYTLDYTHPRRDGVDYLKKEKEKDWETYREYLWNQTEELVTRFGKIDILWFDFTARASERFPGKTKDSWKAEELIKMVRSHQPGIIINDRLDIDQDVKTPEQYTPRDWITVGGKRVVWEGCHTFSGSWGYHRDEQTWKSPEQLVQLLINHVSRGGNLLMNVGPNGRGEFDKRAVAALRVYQEWMEHHGDAIYGCTQAPLEFPEPEGCRYTYNPGENRLYLHVYNWPFQIIHLDQMAARIDYAQFLHDSSEIELMDEGARPHDTSGGEMGLNTQKLRVPVRKPDVTVPVIELFLK